MAKKFIVFLCLLIFCYALLTSTVSSKYVISYVPAYQDREISDAIPLPAIKDTELFFKTNFNRNLDEFYLQQMPEKIRVEVEKNNKVYHIPVPLLYGLMKHESGLNINVKDNINYSEDGVELSRDIGVMMLNNLNFEEFAWKFFKGAPGEKFNPRNYKHNIQVGMAYLRWLYDYLAEEDWTLAVMAYNRGPGRIKRREVTLSSSPTLFKYTFEVVKYSL